MSHSDKNTINFNAYCAPCDVIFVQDTNLENIIDINLIKLLAKDDYIINETDNVNNINCKRIDIIDKKRRGFYEYRNYKIIVDFSNIYN